MPTVAYLANQFPSPVEPYVVDEIRELRRRGVRVVPCSARRAGSAALDDQLAAFAAETLYLQPLRLTLLLRAAWLCLRKGAGLANFLQRALTQGKEPLPRRARTVLHTWLGVYYALLLRGRGVEHIHVHHGYFGSWIAMVAARVLGIRFSMTLHGSDLLLHRAYLDLKLQNCAFCLTVSEYNRRFILEHYPQVNPGKLIVQRIGVDSPRWTYRNTEEVRADKCFILLSVGRLHAVKDHAFLVEVCRRFKDRGLDFLCLIAGEGPERQSLERRIRELTLREEVKLLGHVPRRQLDYYYASAEVVVLTSRSEGIPLVLMEAMALGKTVLAPAITGISELVVDGETGFLYRPGCADDFVARFEAIRQLGSGLRPIHQAARRHVLEHFNRQKNLAAFGDLFLARTALGPEALPYENPVLQ
jgi:glycosyltransferase involved in cell wall biosynthesis